MKVATPKEITDFLKNFKKTAQNKFELIPRKLNLDFISHLGITIRQAKNMIMQLTYENYYNGPEKDRDRQKGNIWEFGADIDNEGVYIKLSDDLSSNIAKCLSFHKPEFKITYPYRKGG